MGTRPIICCLIGACALFGAISAARPAVAVELITPSEAALPEQPSIGRERGISRGPTVLVVSPQPGAGTIKSPLDLRVTFESHNGATVNVDSVLLTYMRLPAVDLTQRVRDFIAPTGVEIKQAVVPPGTHTIRVSVSDSNGRTGTADVTFSVTK
jgi:hypothetical protein